jgi:hypothetical protein
MPGATSKIFDKPKIVFKKIYLNVNLICVQHTFPYVLLVLEIVKENEAKDSELLVIYSYAQVNSVQHNQLFSNTSMYAIIYLCLLEVNSKSFISTCVFLHGTVFSEFAVNRVFYPPLRYSLQKP